MSDLVVFNGMPCPSIISGVVSHQLILLHYCSLTFSEVSVTTAGRSLKIGKKQVLTDLTH